MRVIQAQARFLAVKSTTPDGLQATHILRSEGYQDKGEQNDSAWPTARAESLVVRLLLAQHTAENSSSAATPILFIHCTAQSSRYAATLKLSFPSAMTDVVITCRSLQDNRDGMGSQSLPPGSPGANRLTPALRQLPMLPMAMNRRRFQVLIALFQPRLACFAWIRFDPKRRNISYSCF